MAKRNNSTVGWTLLAIIAVLTYIFTNKTVLIILACVAVFAIIIAVVYFVKKGKKQQSEPKTENAICAVMTDSAGKEDAVKYDLSELPGNVPHFLSAALDLESKKDFLKARVNYMSAVEELKRCTEPSEYEKFIGQVQKMYDEFVLRDPVYTYLMSKLLPIIENENGILQSQISKEFESVSWGTLANGNREVKKEDIYYALYFADRFGHIKRVKKGRSYQLYLPDTQPQQTVNQ